MILLIRQRKAATTGNSRAQARKEVSADFIATGLFRHGSVSNRNFANAERNERDQVIQNVIALAKRLEHRL